MPYLSASAVMLHYEEALYQVYTPLPFTFTYCSWMRITQENVKTLHDEWNRMDAEQKQPYERAAAADADRYRREVFSLVQPTKTAVLAAFQLSAFNSLAKQSSAEGPTQTVVYLIS